MSRKMRVIFYLSLSAALCTAILADHNEDHKEENHDKHDHEKTGDHKHDHDHHHEHHSGEAVNHQQFEKSLLEFTFQIFRQRTKHHASQNVFLTPISISGTLAHFGLGARLTTHTQILEGLTLNRSMISDEEIHKGYRSLFEELNTRAHELLLNIRNALFVSEKFKPLEKFLIDSQEYYQPDLIRIDFQDIEGAKEKINSYVEEKTEGNIVDAVSSVSPDAAMILIIYILFRGEWERPFDEKFTKEGDFHVNENKTVKVPFMSKTGFQEVAHLDDATVVRLPYKENASALFILPKEGRLSKVQSNLQDIVKNYKKSHHKQQVMLSMPKISLSASYDLEDLMTKRGMTDAFSDKADFSGITGDPNLKLSKAKHDAKITIDEKGTEASATTKVEVIPKMVITEITFNQPYLMIIYSHEHNSILFLAKVMNPLK